MLLREARHVVDRFLPVVVKVDVTAATPARPRSVVAFNHAKVQLRHDRTVVAFDSVG
jgi:hypothetical protein